MGGEKRVKSVAIVGAGAAGAITAAAFKAENHFERIQVFERRERPGGTWIYDVNPGKMTTIRPGKLPTDLDPPLKIPHNLPQITPPDHQERYARTPIYDSLTTNVPDIAMSFSDARFAYGPFAPHYIPRQYVENYFSIHKTDAFLVLNTTVEDITKIAASSTRESEKWKVTLRKHDPVRHVDIWWDEVFDAVIIATGHYSIPYVPQVKGLEAYIAKFPGRVLHSKYYRSPLPFTTQKMLVIGNSASGHDLTTELVSSAHLPVYQSRKSKSRWDGAEPPPGVSWKPIIKAYQGDGRIVFEDDTYLDDVDKIIYCTGYKPSFPFWNVKANGRPLWDYEAGKLIAGYWHTFFQDFETLAIVGLPRVLTFRSFEYQAIALARLYSRRNSRALPPVEEQERWERTREDEVRRERRRFHDIPWEGGETVEWLDGLFRIAGLGTLKGEGRVPPVLGKELIWAVEHLRKYPEPGMGKDGDGEVGVGGDGPGSWVQGKEEDGWVQVERGPRKDLLTFI